MRGSPLIRMTEYEFGPADWRSKLRLAKPVLRVLVGSMFVVSGLLKIAYPDAFAKALESHRVISSFGVEVAAVLLPQVEIILGLLLLFAIKTRVVSGLLILLLVMFSTVSVIAILSGRAMDCGCFPVAGATQSIGPGLLIRNGLLILCCLWVASGDRKPQN